MSVLYILVGLVLVGAGAELLVRGASRLAALAGISPLIIGLTVVAWGTGAPELAVSIKASWAGQAEIALGNVVGSNIFAVLCVLGASALVMPLVVANQMIRLDVPVMIAASALTWVASSSGAISRGEGLMLIALFLVYTAFLIYKSKRAARPKGGPAAQAEASRDTGRKAFALPALSLVLGLTVLVVGARWLVDGAVALAHALGVSEIMIGLTIVAVGTSLPEAATSIVAAIRGERDIAVGNVVGSCIFNLLAVLGVTCVIPREGVQVPSGALSLDIPFMFATAVACLPIFFTGSRISRWEGALFLAYYVAYALYLFLHAAGHWTVTTFGPGMFWFGAPLAILGLYLSLLAVLGARSRAERRNPRPNGN